jgi:hypothetical protein
VGHHDRGATKLPDQKSGARQHERNLKAVRLPPGVDLRRIAFFRAYRSTFHPQPLIEIKEE